MARALDLHSRGQGFDSLILHKIWTDRLKEKKIIGQKLRVKSSKTRCCHTKNRQVRSKYRNDGTRDKAGRLQEKRFDSLIIYVLEANSSKLVA